MANNNTNVASVPTSTTYTTANVSSGSSNYNGYNTGNIITTGGIISNPCTCGANGGLGCTCNYWTISPNTYGTGIGTTTSNLHFGTGNIKYAVMDLTRKDMPTTIYVCGRMVTFGILGTDVECAYTGDKLVFSPGVVNFVWNQRTTIIIEYKDEILHYNIGNNGADMYQKGAYDAELPLLNATLVSTIKK